MPLAPLRTGSASSRQTIPGSHAKSMPGSRIDARIGDLVPTAGTWGAVPLTALTVEKAGHTNRQRGSQEGGDLGRTTPPTGASLLFQPGRRYRLGDNSPTTPQQ